MSNVSEKLVLKEGQIGKPFVFGLLLATISILTSMFGTVLFAATGNFMFSKAYKGVGMYIAWFVGQLIPLAGFLMYADSIFEDSIGGALEGAFLTFAIAAHVGFAYISTVAGSSVRKWKEREQHGQSKKRVVLSILVWAIIPGVVIVGSLVVAINAIFYLSKY